MKAFGKVDQSLRIFSILYRYIFTEVFYPLLMALFVFTFVLILGRSLRFVDLMIDSRIDFTDILTLILYLMPALLLFTIPMALLIAILTGIGRLSRDNEFTVMKSSGLSLHQIAAPVLAAALIAFCMAAATSYFLIPKGNREAKNLLFQIVKQKAGAGIKERVFNDDFDGIVFYADRIPASGDFMEGVLLHDERTVEEPSTIIASRGTLVSNPESQLVTLRLVNGSIHTVDGDLKNYKKIDFSTYDVRLDLKGSTADAGLVKSGQLDEMTLWDLWDRIGNPRPDGPPRHRLVIEFHERVAIPFSCLIFAVLGIPLGIHSSRAGKMRGFTIGLALVMVYYVLLLLGKALGGSGRISPAIGVWAPNALFMTVGIYVYFRKARERGIAPEWLKGRSLQESR